MSCGIFGYIGQEGLPKDKIFNLLLEMESLKEETDSSPLGGHGAGYVSLSEGLVPFFNKVGFFKDESSVKMLFDFDELRDEDSFKFFIGHVRRASDEFSSPDDLDELHAHPFVHTGKHYRVYGVHNGFLQNYKELAQRIGLKEFFTDSDVLTRYFLYLLDTEKDISSACEKLFATIEGNNTALFLIEGKEDFFVILLHLGKTRGLVLYENEHGEVFICSRKSLLERHFADFLEKNGFFETLHIKPKEHNLFINWWRVEANPPFKLSEY